jgi:hypothetical protein
VRKTIWCVAVAGGMAVMAPGGVLAQETRVDIQQYDNGGIYEGEFRNGVQHGTGTYRLPNGYEYTGEWVDGEIRGQGVARFPDGSVYEGQFAAGRPQGDGLDHLRRWLHL